MKSKNIVKIVLYSMNKQDRPGRVSSFADMNSSEARRRAGASEIISLGPPVCQFAND